MDKVKPNSEPETLDAPSTFGGRRPSSWCVTDSATCPTCDGDGVYLWDYCTTCLGAGRVGIRTLEISSHTDKDLARRALDSE